MCIKRLTKTMKSLKSRLPNSWATFSLTYYPPKSIMCIINWELIIHLLITPTLCKMLPNTESRNNIQVLFEFHFQSPKCFPFTQDRSVTQDSTSVTQLTHSLEDLPYTAFIVQHATHSSHH
jgi:hypothetical protein